MRRSSQGSTIRTRVGEVFMDERSFLQLVGRQIAEVLAGQRSLEELLAESAVVGWEAHRLGPHADEVVADLEALLAWQSEHLLAEEELRSELRALLARVHVLISQS